MSLVHTYNIHSAAVNGLSLHATGSYFATASADGSWAIHDIDRPQTICHVADKSDKYQDVQFHPDGLILGTATHNKVTSLTL